MAFSTEELCMRMIEFQENVQNAFSILKEDPEFTDVTLACEDGNQVNVH